MELSDMANKDPAMLFYSSDFLTGTALLTMKERGQYITLLALQQQLGHMRRKDMEKVVGRMSEALLAKFCADADGRLYNRRAQEEMDKRAAFCTHQRERGKKRWQSSFGTAPAQPEEDVTENKNENETLTHRNDASQTGESEGERVIRLYRECIEPELSPQRVEALRSYTASLSAEAVCHAITVAADNNKKSWSYVKAILLRYTAAGIRTDEDIRRDEGRRSPDGGGGKGVGMTMEGLLKQIERL